MISGSAIPLPRWGRPWRWMPGGRPPTPTRASSVSIWQFHQINRDPTYRTTGAFHRLIPTGLLIASYRPTLACPFGEPVAETRSDVAPELLTGTDLRGDALKGCRPRSRGTTTIRSGFGVLSVARAGCLRTAGPSVLVVTNQGRARTESRTRKIRLLAHPGLQSSDGAPRPPAAVRRHH